jgi:archaellum component FlaF (FlaF/FlaG flagellin family)
MGPSATTAAAAAIIAFLIFFSYCFWIPELDMVKP